MKRGKEKVTYYTMSGGGTTASLFADEPANEAFKKGVVDPVAHVFRLPIVRSNVNLVLAFSVLSGLIAFLIVNVCVLSDIASIWPPSSAPYAFAYAYVYPNIFLMFLFVPAILFQNYPFFYVAYALALVQLLLNIVAAIYLFAGALMNLNNLGNLSGFIGFVIMSLLAVFSGIVYFGFSVIAVRLAMLEKVNNVALGQYDRAARAGFTVLSMTTLCLFIALVTIGICALTGIAPIWPTATTPYTFGYAFVIPNVVFPVVLIPAAFGRMPVLVYTATALAFVQFILNLAAWLYLYIPAAQEIVNLNTVNALFGSFVLIFLMTFGYYTLVGVVTIIVLDTSKRPSPLRLYKHRKHRRV